MNFIFIEKHACEAIVQNRFFQNLGFPPARNLVAVFRGKDEQLAGLDIHRTSKGSIVTSNNYSTNSDAIIFDLETLTLAIDCNDSELLLVLQKTLRFCVKYWDSLNFSSGEMILKGSSKALVFPFPYVANRSGYRVTIEREPNAKRLSKRTSGRFLLAYKSGKSEGNGANEEAGLTNFRRAYDEFLLVCEQTSISAKSSHSVVAPVSSIGITTLHAANGNLPAEQGFERWKRLLTDEQMNFVNSDCSVPHRLEGPAGTGKTLCLVLKAINVLTNFKSKEIEHKSIFIAPSEEVAEIIKDRFIGNGGEEFLQDISEDYSERKQSIIVVTLQTLCSKLLNYEVDESEFLDRDSVESKNTQLLYLDQIIEKIKLNELQAIKQYLSKELYDFLNDEDSWALAQLLQHEISVVIKGRANGSLEAYKTIPALDYGLPLKTSQDKEYIFRKQIDYQSKLEASNQYDIDDIVISAIGQLDTPIWRRRRQQIGYDSIFIDEVHLFNLNEASVLHFLTKTPASVPISYSIDRSQAVGDIGWNDREFYEAIGSGPEIGKVSTNKISAVFRSSSDIIELAFCVLASGASLFTNFENPLEMATVTFTAEEEKKCLKPCITYVEEDSDLSLTTYKQADLMAKALLVGKDSILVVVFDEQILNTIKEDFRSQNKGFKILERRGDFSTLAEANKAGCLVLSTPELVGGLEFQGVILVGCDKGRLPPSGGQSEFSRAYLNYRAHNNLYVSITRAKFRLQLIVNRTRGISDILRRAIDSGLLNDGVDNA